jgi:DNA-binding CsgD family transcriptional regulator
MSKSARLRTTDLRALLALVGECRDLGDDAHSWWRHFLAELARLTGAGFGLGAEIGGCLHGSRCDLGTTIWGAENGFNLTSWFQMLETFNQDPQYNPLMNSYIARLPGAIGACLARNELILDREWYSSDYYQTLHRTLGADATLTCFQRVPGAEDTFVEVYMVRAVGERDFTGRSRVLVREAFAALAPLVGGPLARFSEPSPAALPPRLRQVLCCLLEGDGDKQIAARLGLSRHTVNEYVEHIFRHFGVVSRTELLARWVRRGWGQNLPPWAEYGPDPERRAD